MHKGQGIFLDKSERWENVLGKLHQSEVVFVPGSKRRPLKFKKWPSTSSQDGVTRMKFTLLPNATKKQTKYMK